MAHQKDEPFCFIVFFDIAKITFFFAKKKGGGLPRQTSGGPGSCDQPIYGGLM